MEHKGKSTRPAEHAPQSENPQALHHFAVARVQELQQLAERCTASPAKVHPIRTPRTWMRLLFRGAVGGR